MDWPGVVGAGTLAVLLALSLPGLHQLWTKAASSRLGRLGRHGRHGRHGRTRAVVTGGARGSYVAVPHAEQPELFASADGVATDESMAAFSDRGPRIVASASIALGLAAALAAALMCTLRLFLASAMDDWSDTAGWTLLGLQALAIAATHPSLFDRRWRLSVFAFASSVVLLASLAARHALDAAHGLSGLSGHIETQTRPLAACWLLQLAAALTTALAFASFPHRPDVFYDGKLVDQQHAVSLLHRFSFNWNLVVFAIANARTLELADLPALDADTRSEDVTRRYFARGGTATFYNKSTTHPHARGRLWWQLLVAFRGTLLLQWLLTFVRSLVALFPQYVIYQFLEDLDKRHDGVEELGSLRLWGWVLGIGVSIVLQVWIGAFQRWVTSSRLEAPLASLVQALIFQKALRLDEAADPGQKDKDTDTDTDNVRQSVVNHMRLDSSRITIFCTYNYWFPLALFKLFLSGSVLVRLLGAPAFFSGAGCAVLVYPASHVISQRYAKIQFGLMKFRDAKAHVLTEALQGMRQIKYSALEGVYEAKILAARNAELRAFWRVARWMCGLMLVVNVGPLLLSCVSLGVYTLTTPTHVRASVIFASLGLFDQLDEAFGYLPLIQVYLMEAWTSCVRVETYLNQPDQARVADDGDEIVLSKATVRWPRVNSESDSDDTRSTLRDVSLVFPAGRLSLVTGKTGAGKSLLLATLLGEVKLLAGTVHMPAPPSAAEMDRVDVDDAAWILPSLTAFVSQTPWVESGTLRNNILFGLPLRRARYRAVLRACALDKDLELFEAGDATEVGPKGVTLSGGQRWRVALARALYSRAGILVLDDVLSAVDAHVGRTIVSEALSGGLARGRTRILATHHGEMCRAHAVQVISLDNGRVVNVEAVDTIPEAEAEVEAEANTETEAETEANTTDTDEPTEATPETKEEGRVKSRVYREYVRASRSAWLWVAIAAIVVSSRLLGVASTWALKELASSYNATVHAWTKDNVHAWKDQHVFDHVSFVSVPATPVGADVYSTSDEYRRNAIFWMSAYVALNYATLLLGVAQQMLIMFTGLRASRVLFERMTHAILRAPLRWVDTVPSGRVLNRFTSDTYTVDRRLASDLSSFLGSSVQIVVVIATSMSVSPAIVVLGAALLVLYGRIASVYIAAAREAKRINSVAHSPVYDQFSSVLTGLSTIRAFRRTRFYEARVYGLINDAAKASWALQLLARWMNFRMGMFGALFVTGVAASIVFGRVDASLAGFGLVFALRYTAALSRLLANTTSIELGFNAAERILEYIDLDTEPQGGRDAPAAWPTQGRLTVTNLSAAYAPDLPPVLKGLNFSLQPGERIGVVGRTGAGKSTLAAVLFRLLEASEGSIAIDGIDIATLRLDHLRRRMAIIPQDPFLFSGTLRSNLDLEGVIADDDLHQALKRVHLVADDDDTVAGSTASNAPDAPDSASTTVASDADAAGLADAGASFKNLEMPVATGGGNLSQGQRQLICLARALLARPKVVVLDEATSAVDRATDAAIQASLRREFASTGCTVLVVAHRLSTVVDFDRVLVLDSGRVAELGTPRELMERGMALDKAEAEAGGGGEREFGAGAFWELVKKSAEKDKLLEMVF